MARITVEDCLTKETNRFALVLLAAKRTKQILNGSKSLITDLRNKAVVTSLREIAAGKVRFMTEEERRAEEERRREEAAARARERQAAAALAEAAKVVPGATPLTGPTFEGDSTSDSTEGTPTNGDAAHR